MMSPLDDRYTRLGSVLAPVTKPLKGGGGGGARPKSGGAATTDPHWANVILLLKGEGTNGSTTITDSSSAPRLVQALGNAQISTAQFKFGSSSITFDGAGDYLRLASDETNFALGTGDFTIEMWLRMTNVATAATLYDGRGQSVEGAFPTLYVTAAGEVGWYASSAVRISGAHGLSSGVFGHIAVSRAAGITRLFAGGVQVGANFTDSINYLANSTRPTIGISAWDVSSNALNGQIDELRVTKGVGRYTTTFTPPTAAFPTSA